jgi:tRNA A-37 threonylcarbamoyl transferase component Bud32
MDPLIGRVLLDRYEVLRRVGSGGMGAVYAGKQAAVGREVAMKVLRSDLMSNEMVKERFRREAEIIGKLRHPNTIQLIDYGETTDGLAVMVMELLIGQPLSDRLKQLGPMPTLDALRIGMEIAGSLAEAHGQGLVHRDLKPGNIFLVEVAGKNHAKVLDFGIARMLDEEATRITSTGQVFGTPRYMSPEQGLASGEVDSRSDIYSLGLIIYECLVGNPPFVANTSIQYLSAHATLPPPKLRDALPGAPSELEELVDRCLAKERQNRVQTADLVAEGLRRIALKLETGAEMASARARSSVPPAAPTTGGPGGPSHSQVSLLGTGGGGGAGRPPEGPTGTMIAVDKDPSRPDMRGFDAPPPSLQKRKSALPMVLAGVIVLGIVGAVFARGYLSGGDGGEVVALSTDAGALVPDAATVLAAFAIDGTPDAGGQAATVPETARPDGGDKGADKGADKGGDRASEAHPETPTKHLARRDKDKDKDKEPKDPKGRGTKPPKESGGDNTPSTGVVSGPRAIWVPFDGDDKGPFEAAKKCTKSTLPAGPAKLTLKPCEKGCAVIVDGACAGRTPIVDLPIPAGNKSVTVVCGSAVVVDSLAKLRPGETTNLSCR